jgi:hypothetical protein
VRTTVPLFASMPELSLAACDTREVVADAHDLDGTVEDSGKVVNDYGCQPRSASLVPRPLQALECSARATPATRRARVSSCADQIDCR